MSTKSWSLKKIFISLCVLITLLLFFWLSIFFTNPLDSSLALFSALFILFIFMKPLRGLFFLIIIRPTLDIFTSQPILLIDNQYSLNIASLFAILAISFSLIVLIKNYKTLQNIPLKFPLFLFILVTFSSIFYSVDTVLSFAEWLRIISIFSLYTLGFTLIREAKDFQKIIYAIIFSVLLPGLVALYQFFTKTGMTIVDEDISNRIFGTFAHPNLFAYYLTLPLVLAIFLVLYTKKNQLKNFLLYLIIFFTAMLLTLTYTRGAWVAFLVTVFILGIVSYHKFLLGIITALVLIYFLTPAINTRVNNLFEYNPYSSVSWRINLWKDGISYAQKKLLTGYGLGTANKIILNERGEKFGSPDPHNDYLKILIENGLTGLLAYLFLIITLILKLIHDYKKTMPSFYKNFLLLILGLSIALYSMSFADNILRNTALQWVFWVLLGALFSQIKIPSTLLREDGIALSGKERLG